MNHSHYVNRELGWLRFNERVLFQAEDPRNPLLERVRFLNIANSNLDEFFMKRVGGLQRQLYAGYSGLSVDGLTPSEQLELIRKDVLRSNEKIQKLLKKDLIPALKKENMALLRYKDLSKEEKKWAKQFFTEQLFSVLTPMAVDLGHPFPLISNLTTSLALSLKSPNEEDLLFARVKVPDVFPEWIQIPHEIHGTQEARFVSMVDIIRKHLDLLFPQMSIQQVMTFRVTRNLDVETDPEDAEDLLEFIEDQMKRRKFADVVRLEHGPKPDPWLLNFLIEELELETSDIYEFPLPIEYKNLDALLSLAKPDLKYKPWNPVAPLPLNDDNVSIFPLIRNSDLLIHMPYESFSSSVEKFIVQASTDPDVLAIKVTLYRTGKESLIAKSLIRASEAGKQVVCLVELKARMDEEKNIQWAHEMEKAGVHVVYGIVNLKTHAKIALVARKEKEGVRSYAHIGTGNFHSVTARVYTDMSLLTSDPQITHELTQIFHYLTGRSLKTDYEKLLVAPINMKKRFLDLIEQETQFAREKKAARIVVKCNSLEDSDIIEKLYEASSAGVQIDLIVRGFSCLRPHVIGLSENIRVVSIIGPFLEHSRVFVFQSGGESLLQGQFFIGSGDWMSRNLNGRVEVACPIEKESLKKKVWDYLELLLNDSRLGWEMEADGSYHPRGDFDLNEPGSHFFLAEKTKSDQLSQLETSRAQLQSKPSDLEK